jgi:tetratricopeptide (TPR) repeat protein
MADDVSGAARQLRALLRTVTRQRHSPIVRAAVHNQLGILSKATRRYSAALRHYRIALPIVRRHPDNPWFELADLYHNLGGLAHARGDYAAGEPLARKAVTLRARRHGARAIVTWLDRAAHASLLDGLGRHAEAARVYRAVLPVFRRHFGPGHYEVAVTLNNLGCSCARQGQWLEAIRHLRLAARLKLRLFGRASLEVALTRRNLARVLALRAGPA